jgi:hypothetical protein
MNKSVNEFFSSLHRENLKPRGYTKIRHTFSRSMGSYTERIQFQGSAWNDSNSPWRFYINFGVEFYDLSPRDPCRDFSATHCWTRLDTLLPSAAKEYDLPDPVPPAFATEIAGLLQQGSDRVASTIQQVRLAYESKSWPLFPDA